MADFWTKNGQKSAKNDFFEKKFWNKEFLVKVICMQNFSFIQQLFWILRGVCWYSTPPGNSGPFWGSGKLGLNKLQFKMQTICREIN